MFERRLGGNARSARGILALKAAPVVKHAGRQEKRITLMTSGIPVCPFLSPVSFMAKYYQVPYSNQRATWRYVTAFALPKSLCLPHHRISCWAHQSLDLLYRDSEKIEERFSRINRYLLAPRFRTEVTFGGGFCSVLYLGRALSSTDGN